MMFGHSIQQLKKTNWMKHKLSLLIIFIACVYHFCCAKQKLKVVLAALSHDHVTQYLTNKKAGK
jgi:hypothetical protein